MITEEALIKAMQWLVDNAEPAAVASSNRQYLEAFSKTLKAEIMSEHIDEPVNAQERHAYADERYKTHLLGWAQAIKEDEKFRWLAKTAHARIEVWRTMQANLRNVR